MSKILILTASPTRDLIVDTILAEELLKKGHEVHIRPCLREGRDAVLEHRPDVVVMPPIRNPYSRDMVETLKHWGIGVVSRHTEPSCDWQDYKKMEPHQKADITGRYPYVVDAELVWGADEADILNRRGCPFQTYPCGAFTVDAHVRQDVIAKHRNKEEFCKKFGFDSTKKTLLICSAWGFADSAPDLHVDDVDHAKRDIEGRDRHFRMIRCLAELDADLLSGWNILITAHPGVVEGPYKELCDKLGLAFDTETTSFDLKVNVDGIIHAGSTMAIGAHYLGIPAWQFGDINAKDMNSWWANPESAISKVSPYFTDEGLLRNAILESQPGSNANEEALKTLEEGRFGLMDGKATERAAEIIDKVTGKFTLCWPMSVRDYSQITIKQDPSKVVTVMPCGICKNRFIVVNDSYLHEVKGFLAEEMFRQEILSDTDIKEKFMKIAIKAPHGGSCPHCAARFHERKQ